MSISKICLAIETSCDETAVSIVEVRGPKSSSGMPFSEVNVRAHVVESQIAIHQPFGGVVPEVAARDHLSKIDGVARRALTSANLTVSELNCVAVTKGPGLIGALMVGALYAEGLALALGVDLIAVNHVDAHLAPALCLESFQTQKDLCRWMPVREMSFPSLALTVSGGHCMLSRLENLTNRTVLGQTLDDACGEAFDKVAKLLGFPYPGGPIVEQVAKGLQASPFVYPHTLQDKSQLFNFSFSGLKTAVLDTVRRITGQHLGKISGAELSEETKAQICFSFQEAAIGQLYDRVKNALQSYPESKSLFVAGGVAANARFRERFAELGIPVVFAPVQLCSDNATMIALQALLAPNSGEKVKPFPRYKPGVGDA